MSRRLVPAVAAATLILLTGACGAHGGSSQVRDPDADGFGAAADTETCVHDAIAVTSTPAGFPSSFPFPKGTVVFHIEDRGPDGVLATGITAASFDQVLAAMNASKKAGFKITSGETEDDDAEANWTGNGYVGRWAIKKSAACPGQTVVQLLSKRNSR